MNVLIRMSGFSALRDFFERLRHDQRIETKSVFIDAAVFERQRRGLAVGDHDDLPHVFFLLRQDALCQAQTFARVRVIRSHLHASQFAQRHFFGAVVKRTRCSESPGYWVRIRCESAIATRLAGVKRSSP